MSELGDKLALIGLADKLAELEKRIIELEQSKEAVMTKSIKEVLTKLTDEGHTSACGEFDRALKELEALIRTEKLKLLAEIGEPKLGDIVLMQPEQYAGGVIIDEWYKNRINKLEAEL